MDVLDLTFLTTSIGTTLQRSRARTRVYFSSA
jgi:hypothetical protein